MRFKALVVLLLLVFNGVMAQVGPPEKPLNDYPVQDYVGLFSKQEANAINQKVLSYFDTTGTEIVVVIVETTHGQGAIDYANWIIVNWGIGKEDEDNGIVLLIAVEDRQTAIATGYGIEQHINSVLAQRIIDNEINPQFKSGNFYGGVNAGLDAIFAALNGQYDGTPRGGGNGKSFGLVIFILIIVLLMVFRKNGGSGGGNTAWIISSVGAQMLGGGGGFGGGGFGGGGGGGFGGFGGGSSGGGGASGGW